MIFLKLKKVAGLANENFKERLGIRTASFEKKSVFTLMPKFSFRLKFKE